MDTTSRPTTIRLAAGALATGLLLTACGGGDEGGPIDLASSFPSAAVCNGEPSDVNPPASDPFSGYVYLNDGDGWGSGWSNLFGGEHAIIGDDATTILCASVATTTEADRCEYEDDGETFTLVMASATYDVELRTAETADVLAAESIAVAAEECPMVTSWTPGEGERTSYPRPSDDQLQSAIGEF